MSRYNDLTGMIEIGEERLKNAISAEESFKKISYRTPRFIVHNVLATVKRTYKSDGACYEMSMSYSPQTFTEVEAQMIERNLFTGVVNERAKLQVIEANEWYANLIASIEETLVILNDALKAEILAGKIKSENSDI